MEMGAEREKGDKDDGGGVGGGGYYQCLTL